MESFIGALAWPCVALILGLVALVMFQKDIRSFIGRVKSLPGGIKADPALSQQQLERANQAPAPPPSGAIPGPMPLYDDLDRVLREELENASPGNIAAQLSWAIRLRSMAVVEAKNEGVFRLIFASQIKALMALNQRPHANLSEGLPFFEEGLEGVPIEHRPAFSDWTGYLFRSGLIEALSPPGALDPVVRISVMGREFLAWLIRNGIDTTLKEF